MRSVPRPFPSLTGPGRRAHWRRSVLRRVLAAVCLGAAVAAGLQTLRPPPPPVVELVVAAGALPAGSLLGADDVTLAPVPVAARPPGSLSAVADAVGRRIGSGLAAGEALTVTRLVPRSPAEGLARGAVALHVLLADAAAADLLTPGQRVTVYPVTGGPALADVATVLAVDPAVADAGPLGGGTASARGVVLALGATQAVAVLAGHGGLDGPPAVNLAVLPP